MSCSDLSLMIDLDGSSFNHFVHQKSIFQILFMDGVEVCEHCLYATRRVGPPSESFVETDKR